MNSLRLKRLKSVLGKAPEWFFRLLPAMESLRHYSFGALRSDTLAGLTVAAVAVPQAMAYASIFGVPVEYGLYTAIVTTAVGALFDPSRLLIKGPTNAISIALLSALATVPLDARVSSAVLLALLVGLIQIGITLCRLGDLSRYISQAVLVGFTVGAAVLLVLDQFKNLIGLTDRGNPDDHFLKRFWETVIGGGGPHAWTVYLGLGAILTVILLRLMNRRLRFPLPDLLLTIIAAAAVVWALGLDHQGVKVAGEIPASLPTLRLPAGKWIEVRALGGSAMAIALLGLLESIAMAKALAARTGQKLDINQECLSEGVSNIAGSLFQCFPGSGSLTRSAINHRAGAVTQLSAVISALAVGATILLFAPLAHYIPRAALAGILVVSAWHMVDRKQLAYHWRATRYDRLIMLATALSAVAISVEFCIMIGTFLSFVLYVPRAARVLLTELVVTPDRVIRERAPDDPYCGRMLLYNLEGELFFGSAPELEDHFATIDARARDGIRIVLLRLKRARNTDALCIKLLEEFVDRMERRGIQVLLCGVRDDLAKVLRRSGLAKRLGPNRIFPEVAAVWSSTLEAARHAYELIGDDLCQTCPRRQESRGSEGGMYYMI